MISHRHVKRAIAPVKGQTFCCHIADDSSLRHANRRPDRWSVAQKGILDIQHIIVKRYEPTRYTGNGPAGGCLKHATSSVPFWGSQPHKHRSALTTIGHSGQFHESESALAAPLAAAWSICRRLACCALSRRAQCHSTACGVMAHNPAQATSTATRRLHSTICAMQTTGQAGAASSRPAASHS